LTRDIAPDFAQLRAAAARIAAHAHRTPVFSGRSLDAIVGAQLLLKCENLQRTGAFKFRGACNAVMLLEDSHLATGVATHSSGSHGAAPCPSRRCWTIRRRWPASAWA
jgi:threonine dehydratase